MEPQMTGDEIVISGISGKFPNCENINELQKNLFDKADCAKDSKIRWDYDHPEVPPRIGVTKEIDKFDSLFFGIHGHLAKYMDPMMRIMLETTYEAVTDAGINPRKLKGSKSAIYTASWFSESENALYFEKLKLKGHNLMGVSRAMLANRLAFFFGTTGPSINIYSSCCGGATALQEGYRAIKEGRVECAIIGASNVVLHPQTSLQLFLLGLLSPDGKTKSFDNAADGYTRSEGTVALFLQKARDAKRIYAEIKNARMCFGNSNNDFSSFYASQESQANMMRMTLKECGLSGKDISFVEADGSGIKNVDAAEVKAIDEVYNEGRESPLLIGSVKSNLGSCPAANPINGIFKVIIAMESGYIPPNLNFKTPSDKISALKEGRCKVVTESVPWSGDYAVVNGLGLTGASVNIILKAYKKEKRNGGKPDDNLPRLVICSGSTEEAINVILDEMENRPIDVEMLHLLYNIFETEIPTHMYRGYTLLSPQGLPKISAREIQFKSGVEREVWYMFSGMGSQWIGMGDALMQIPIFAEAINKCDKVLKPRGFDIVHIITEKDPKMFENIVHSFIGIAAIQIGLVDVLSSIGLQPDFLIGHSVGELGCAYADGCFTAEQMILAALGRGLASIETEMPKGSMAAVGLGYEEIKNLCPHDIDVACHNSTGSSTISGPADSMKAFVAQLKMNKIFAKEVACSNIAYHSRYIAPAGEKLRRYLQEIIPNPKPRSKRWVSSSVPPNEWNSARARLSSAEYHTNNLLSSVLFDEASRNIPPNAIVIEIAPHGLLQAIVRKSFSETVTNVPLTKRGHPDNVSFLFDALGKLYSLGYNINVSKLYPHVSFPVSRGTPSISSLIKWDHSINWYTTFFQSIDNDKEGEMSFIINLKEDKWKYLKHANIYDKIFVPTFLYLELAWNVLKSFKNDTDFSVVFQDIIIHTNQLEIPENEKIELVVMVQKGTGNFEVTSKDILLCSGIILATNIFDHEYSPVPKQSDKCYQNLSENEIYNKLQMRGLQYSGPFKTIKTSSITGSNGILVWKNDWTSFIEGMMQLYILGNDSKRAQVPSTIKKIIINLKLQEESINQSNEISATIHRTIRTVSAGGVRIEGIKLKSYLYDSWKNKLVIEKLQISPSTDGALSNLSEILHMTLQFLSQNSKKSNIVRIIEDKTVDVKKLENMLRSILQETLQTTRFKIQNVPFSWLSHIKGETTNFALLILCNIEQHSSKDILNLISGESFLLIFAKHEQEDFVSKIADFAGLGLVLKKSPSNNQVALLFRRRQTISKTCVLDINDDKNCTNQITAKLNSKDCDRLIIAIRSKECSNLCEIVEALQKEQNVNKIRIVDVEDAKVLNFSLEDSVYSSHINLDLTMNILLPGKVWGMYTYFPISSNLRPVSNWTARQMNTFDLGSICWVEEEFFKTSEDIIKVEYSAVNKEDIFLATSEMALEDTGNNNSEIKTFGLEYSGIDSRGNRVMGISANGSLSNFTMADTDFTWKIPDNWSLEDAATIPIAYTVAYLAVIVKGILKDKESAFVYDGTSSIGQAAINLALNIKSQVIVGHANDNGKQFIIDNYPNIPKNQIIRSSGIFADQIIALTEGKGVDLVICNTDDVSKIQTCMTCVKDRARVIVVENLQKAYDKSVGMLIFANEVFMSSIIPTNVTYLDLAMKKKLSQMVQYGITTGVVRPLSRHVYSRQMLKNAFNDRASISVLGKIIVKVQPQDGGNEALSVPRFMCKSGGSYLIIEGLSDFGLELIDFLVARGARNVVIVSESQSTRVYCDHKISLWKKYGVTVVVREELNLSYQQNVNDILKDVSTFGIVDAIFDLQRIGNSSRMTSTSKYLFTKYLFEMTQQLFPDLRQFVVFSTCKDIKENVDDVLLREIGLTKIFREESKETFPGLLILLGPITGIGDLTTECEINVPSLSISSIMEQLDNLMELRTSIVSICCKSSQVDAEKIENEIVPIVETEKSKFDKYIALFRPSTMSSSLPVSNKN